MTRKINHESNYNVRQDLFAESYGELVNDGAPWTNDQIDALLDAFLVDELRYLSSRNCLRRVTGRSQEAVSGMIWKLAVNYDRPAVHDYLPGPGRKARTLTPFTLRDKAIVEAATGQEGQRNNACYPVYLSRVLMRTPEEITEFYATCKQQWDRSYGRGRIHVESLATTVNRVVQGSHKRLMAEIGF